MYEYKICGNTNHTNGKRGVNVFLKIIFRKLSFWIKRINMQKQLQAAGQEDGGQRMPTVMQAPPVEPSSALAEKLEDIHGRLENCADMVIRKLDAGGTQCAICFIDGLVNPEAINTALLRPLLEFGERCANEGKPLDGQRLAESVLQGSEVKREGDIGAAISACMVGDTALLVDGLADVIIVNTKGWDKRSVSEAQSEAVIRGPREGFTENLRTNTALLRRRIKSAQFKMKNIEIGTQTKTAVCMAYIEGIADPRTVSKVEYRLKKLDVDSILDSGYIEEFIEDAPFAIFPTVGYTEKPDVAAARILEGRIAIVVDGSPFVLTAPMLFVESFQTAEDYYTRPLYGSFTRLMRFIAFFMAIFGPAIYIALVSFHQEFIPTTLLFSIADTKEGTPFPAAIETLIMVFSFELLKEAGIRLPKAVGQAISIVGALVMGEAAVSAGFVGAPLVITVALTGVAGFVIPEQNEPIAIMRVVALLFAACLGGFGIAVCFLGMLIHLSTLESFGVPYYSSALLTRNRQDMYIRFPLWAMTKRPDGLALGNVKRRKFFVPPLRPHADEPEMPIMKELEKRWQQE